MKSRRRVSDGGKLRKISGEARAGVGRVNGVGERDRQTDRRTGRGVHWVAGVGEAREKLQRCVAEIARSAGGIELLLETLAVATEKVSKECRRQGFRGF